MLLNHVHLQRKTFLLLSVLILCAFSILIPLKSAHAREVMPQKATLADLSPCVPSNGGAHINCYSPSSIVINSPCTGTQYWNTTDYSGVPISWTYTNGNSWCVSVRYTTLGDPRNCSYEFYVPNGYATATFVIGYVSNGVHYVSAPIDEEPITGWYTFLSNVSHVTSFDFADNNGQDPGAYQIGWGSDWHYSIKENCF